MSNFAGWKNSLEFLWCRYNSIPLHSTQLPILRERHLNSVSYKTLLLIWAGFSHTVQWALSFFCSFFWQKSSNVIYHIHNEVRANHRNNWKNKAIHSNFISVMKICKIQFLGANNSFCFCPAFGGDYPKVSGGCVIQDSIFCHTNTTEL